MEEKRNQLFPYFAYIKSIELNPDKYGNAQTMEEWSTLIKENDDDLNTIVSSYEELSDEEIEALDKQYQELQSKKEEEQMQYAAKGARLQYLKNGAKPKKVMTKSKTKTCSCGCKMVLSKNAGGKLTETCACNCKGGKLKK